MGRLFTFALAFFGLLLSMAHAGPGKRVALVLGNGTYEEAGKLTNPVNDALDIAAKLRDLGFTVIEGSDLGKRDLERRIGDFSDALEGADAGLFYYAGHGLQVGGRNFIVPVDARLDVPAKLTLEAVPIDQVLDIMEQSTRTSIVFLDACRNNPFARTVQATSARSAAALPGLAAFDASRSSFIAFSTSPGAVAMDGSGRNSPFAAALLRHMGEPGQSVNDLMIAVRRDVLKETREFQRPFETGSLLDRFEFTPAGEPAIAAKPAIEASVETPVQVSTLERSVKDKGSVENFLRRDYLAPDAKAIGAIVKRLYADPATLFGTQYSNDTIVRMKSDWFAQWKSWTLTLEPGSLDVTPMGKDRANAVFAMSYEYVPKNKAAETSAGRARIYLELTMTDGGWRIASEASEAAK